MENKSRISALNIKLENIPQAQNLMARDQDVALRDLEKKSFFQPYDDQDGPYNLSLSVEENRLVFRIKNALNADLPMLVLSLKPYARLIKDYFIIVQSYDEALRDGKPSRVEAIDMGRRGLHNEGAALLRERLEDKIELDMGTARRLFTLICALHAEKVHILR